MPDNVLSSADVKFLIGLKPDKAIEFLKQKGYEFSWDWQEIFKEAHNKAFTVAKVMKLDILQDIKEEVDRSLQEGTTFQDFQRSLKPILKTKGWWGQTRADQVPGYDPNSGIPPDKIIQLGSPRRLETIYRTNIRTSMAQAKWAAMQSQKQERPYVQYLQVQRPNKRDSHAKLNEKIFSIDDPVLNVIAPPNGFGCDCRLRSLTKDEVKELGLEVTPGKEINFTPENGWDYNPGKKDFKPDLNKYDKKLADQYKKEMNNAKPKSS